MPSRIKRQILLLLPTGLAFAFGHMSSALAQMVICTTQEGISFTTTQSDRYNLAVAGCQVAGSEAASEPAPDTIAENDYAAQMNLFDSKSPPIIVPDLPVRRRELSDIVTVSNDAGAPVGFERGSAPPFHQIMSTVGRARKIDPYFLQAITRAESGHNRYAISRVGARGLMQLMPATAARYAQFSDASVLNDPLTNVSIAAAYLKTLQSRYGNNLPLILAAYNAGEGAVAKYGNRIPPYRETQDYVVKVLKYYQAYRSKY